MTKQHLKLVVLAMAALSFGSCIDERYDLDNVDMTVGTTGDLTLPTNSTGDILLSNILDVSDDGVVQAVGGKLFLVETGNANVPSIDINSVSIARPVLSNLDARVELVKGAPASSILPSMASGSFPSVPHQSYNYPITPEDKVYYRIPANTQGAVPDDVVSVSEFSFVDNTTLEMKVNVSFGSKYKFIKQVHLDNMKIILPKGLKVKNAHVAQVVNGVEKVTAAKDIDNEKGIIVMTGSNDNSTMHLNNEALVMRVTFDKAIVGEEGVTFDGKYVKMDGIFQIDGSYRIETSEFDHSLFTTQQSALIQAAGSYDVVCPTALDMKGRSAFNSDIYVNELSGEVLSHVDDINPITLDDMPDFLNEPDVVLDLVNPVFYISVNNPLPGKLTTSLALTSVYHDGTPSISRASEPFSLPAASACVVRVADNFDGLELPEKFQGMTVVDVRIEDLAGLLRKLPDAIDVEIDDVRMAVQGLTIPQSGETDTYHVTIDYEVCTPLELGEETKLIYKGVEEGLSKDLEDVNKMDTKSIEITAVAETNFPLDLTLSVDAQDINGQSLVNEIVTVDDVEILAHEGTEGFSSRDLKLTIKPMEGHTIRQLLQRMDKFVYRAVAQGDGKLMENTYLKLTKIKVTLKGGVSYDAN